MTPTKLIRKKNTNYRRGGLKRKYAAGGSQYDNNVTSIVGQGNPSNTIINTESNPELLNNQEKELESTVANQQEGLNAIAEANTNTIAQGQENIANAAANANAGVEGYTSTVGTTAKTLKEAQPDIFKGIGEKLNKFGRKVANKRSINKLLRNTDKGIEAAKTLQKTDPVARMAAAEQTKRVSAQLASGKGLGPMPTLKVPSMSDAIGKMGSKPMSNLSLGADKLDLGAPFKPTPLGADKMNLMAGKTSEELSKISTTGVEVMSTIGTEAGKELGKKGLSTAMGWGSKGMMSTTGVGAAGVGTGLGKFATSGAGIGTIASLAGEGVKLLADDKDATTVNAGEGIGAGLAGAGTGIGAVATAGALMGSAVPVLGTAIGAAAGAIYGVGKAMFARNKARKEKTKMEEELTARKDKYNTEFGESYAQQKGMMMMAQNKIKETSGYDMGNSSARFGGPRLRRATA